MSDTLGGRYKKIKRLSSNEKLQQLTFLVEDMQIFGRKYIAKLYADVEDESQEKEFRQNIDILSNPVFEDNPGLSKLRDAGEDRYVRYLIFDYVPGNSLKEIIERDGKLNSDGVERLVNQILLIIKPIHEAGFVHRDIKPSNIIIREDGTAIIIDFDAVARLDAEHLGITTATAFTSGYASPEQELGLLSPQNDLYALGMTAIKALTLQDPHLLNRQTNGQINLSGNLELGYCLEAVLLALTHETPTQRYFSCDEVLDALATTQRVAPPLDDEEFDNGNIHNDIPRSENIGLGKIAILFLVFITGSFACGYLIVINYLSIPSSPTPVVVKPTNTPSKNNPNRIRPPSSDSDNSKQDEKSTDEEIPSTVQPSTPKVSIARNGKSARKSDTNQNSQPNFNIPTEEKPASVSENSDSGHWFVDGRQK